jgi:hypothetical protein
MYTPSRFLAGFVKEQSGSFPRDDNQAGLINVSLRLTLNWQDTAQQLWKIAHLSPTREMFEQVQRKRGILVVGHSGARTMDE